MTDVSSTEIRQFILAPSFLCIFKKYVNSSLPPIFRPLDSQLKASNFEQHERRKMGFPKRKKKSYLQQRASGHQTHTLAAKRRTQSRAAHISSTRSEGRSPGNTAAAGGQSRNEHSACAELVGLGGGVGWRRTHGRTSTIAEYVSCAARTIRAKARWDRRLTLQQTPDLWTHGLRSRLSATTV